MDDKENSTLTIGDVVQWCLDNGVGIIKSLGVGYTTDIELEERGKDNARCVEKDTVEWYLEAAHESHAVKYAVKNDMSALDVDEWLSLNEATGVNLSYEDFHEINGLLWEKYDFSPMDIDEDVAHNADTVRKAILEDLSDEDEKTIGDILRKYDGFKLVLESEQLDLADKLEGKEAVIELTESESKLADLLEQHLCIKETYHMDGKTDFCDGILKALNEIAEDKEFGFSGKDVHCTDKNTGEKYAVVDGKAESYEEPQAKSKSQIEKD